METYRFFEMASEQIPLEQGDKPPIASDERMSGRCALKGRNQFDACCFCVQFDTLDSKLSMIWEVLSPKPQYLYEVN